IKGLIASSAAQVRMGVTVVGETGHALAGIVTQVSGIDGLIKEIAGSSREQATALSEVNTAINQVDQITQQNAAMVEQTTAAASALKSEAKELEKLVGGFQTGQAAPAAVVRPPSAVPANRAAVVQPYNKPSRTRAAVAVGARYAPPLHDTSWEEF
ncbi:MAG: methyl-accepting chemotaxis protein, partial [Caulobacteraceae bacterium]